MNSSEMLQMEKRHFEEVKKFCQNTHILFMHFMSRAKGSSRRLSDLDICFFGNIPWNVRAHIDEDFEESNLPFLVDVVDWNSCDENFQNLIKKDLVLLQQDQSS